MQTARDDWVKSSLSRSNGHCAEVAAITDGISEVEASKNLSGGVLSCTQAAWGTYAGDAHDGKFGEVAATRPTRSRRSWNSRRTRKCTDWMTGPKAAAVGSGVLVVVDPRSWHSVVQHSSSGAFSGWSLASGIGIGVFTSAVAIGIAYWQHFIQKGQRSADRREQEAKRDAEAARQRRIDQREKRRADYDAIRGLLDSYERLAYHLDREGPLTATALADQDVAPLRRDSVLLAERDVPGLREPLLSLADSLDVIVQHGKAIEDALAKLSTSGSTPDAVLMHNTMRSAQLQDREVRELKVRIETARKAFDAEWGN
jgi:hypothetical protein